MSETCNPYDLQVNEIVDVWRMSTPEAVRMRVTSLPEDWDRAVDPTPALVGVVVDVWMDEDMPLDATPVIGEVERVPVTDVKSVRYAYEEVDA